MRTSTIISKKTAALTKVEESRWMFFRTHTPLNNINGHRISKNSAMTVVESVALCAAAVGRRSEVDRVPAVPKWSPIPATGREKEE
jgi:hypothetical protein